MKKKKKPSTMQPADFGYSAAVKQQVLATVESVVEPTVMTIGPAQPRKKLGVGKSNSTKSLKVPTVIHSELNLLGYS